MDKNKRKSAKIEKISKYRKKSDFFFLIRQNILFCSQIREKEEFSGLFLCQKAITMSVLNKNQLKESSFKY